MNKRIFFISVFSILGFIVPLIATSEEQQNESPIAEVLAEEAPQPTKPLLTEDGKAADAKEGDLAIIAPSSDEEGRLEDASDRPDLKSSTRKETLINELLNPWEDGNPNELIEFDFDAAELSNVVDFFSKRFNITFLFDSILTPLPPQSKSITGIKLSFRTNNPLPKKDAWGLFTTFLHISGFTLVPQPHLGRTYRVMTTSDPKAPNYALREPLPTLIGVNPTLIPDNDSFIRYVYFVRNASIDAVKNIIDAMKSQAAPPLIIFPDIRGILITDRAYNIKTLIEVIEELDKASTPETMSIIRLLHTDASKIAEFYRTLIRENEQEQQSMASRITGSRRSQTLAYFPPGIRVIPEPRTNTLILLGSIDGIKKVEEFILHELDKQTTLTHRFTKVYPLKYVQAEAVAAILSDVVKFKAESDAAKAGGVRDGDKFFRPLSIIAEKTGNRLIITGDYEDYLKLAETIEKIDVEQPQVAFTIFIVNIDLTDEKDLGTQIRSKKPGVSGLTGDSVTFQTSALDGTVIERSTGAGATRLLGDLVQIALAPTAGVGNVGSTFLTLGSDAFGVWGMLRFLETYTHTKIVTNPFLITVNNTPASIILGDTRVCLKAVSYGQTTADSYEDVNALLQIKLTPRISYEGYISLDASIIDEQFTSTASDNANRVRKELHTQLTLANNETVVLGGLVQTTDTEYENQGSPFGKIPIIGWLLGKVKNKVKRKTSLVVFITPEIIPVKNTELMNNFTASKYDDVCTTMEATQGKYQRMDPIHRWYFDDNSSGSAELDNFVAAEGRYTYPTQKTKSKGEVAAMTEARAKRLKEQRELDLCCPPCQRKGCTASTDNKNAGEEKKIDSTKGSDKEKQKQVSGSKSVSDYL